MIRKKLFFLVILSACLVSSANARADVESLFDSSLTYDIYFYGSDVNSSVIKNVDIKGITEIAGRSFLIVKSKGFKLNEESGYILFDSIIAILPERNFNVQQQSHGGIRKY